MPKSSTSLGFFQANYCTLLLSSMADTVAPGSTYLSKCCLGHGNEVGMGFSLWPLIGAGREQSCRRSIWPCLPHLCWRFPRHTGA